MAKKRKKIDRTVNPRTVTERTLKRHGKGEAAKRIVKRSEKGKN